jgi:V/A-type H+-transporting ATPase subunit I
MLVASILFIKLKEPEGEMGKLARLVFLCSFPTIIFGVLYGSFFGGAESLIFGSAVDLKPLWVDPVNEPITVLIAGMVFGIIHIFTGLGIKAYCLIRDGHFIYAVADVFSWYALIIGLIWILIGPFAKNAGTVLAIVGAATILLTAGRDNKSIVGKFFGGVYSLYGITSYLGDVLSYSRLLALGLASGLIGWSFNLLIGLLGGGIVEILFGPIIFLAGHTFNFLIGALGAYVHTSRLQYLEFFGKFYEGGGRAFDPLKIKTRFTKIVS